MKHARTSCALILLTLAGTVLGQTVGYWQFEEGTDGAGTPGQAPTTSKWVVNDFDPATNGTVGQGGSGPAYVAVTAPGSPRKLGLQFTSSKGDNVTISNSSVVNLSENQDQTIEILIQVNAANSDSSTDNWIVSKDYADTSHKGWGIVWNDATGRVTFQVANQTATSVSRIDGGLWHHVAVVHAANSGTYDLYVDHVKEATISGYTLGAVSSGPLLLGAGYGWQGPRDFVGIIDQFRISRAVLSPSAFIAVPTTYFQPAGYWRFDEGTNGAGATGQAPTTSGWIVNDIAGSPNATANRSASGPLYIAGGNGGLAMKFTAEANDYVQIPNNYVGNLPENRTFTVELLVRVDGPNSDPSTDNWIVSKDYANSTNKGWGIYYDDGTGNLGVNIAGNIITSRSSLVKTWWHHVAITHVANTGTYNLYVNHVKEASLSYTGGAVSSGAVYLGQGFGWQNVRDFVGTLDNFRITDKALTPDLFLPRPDSTNGLLTKVDAMNVLAGTLEARGKLDIYGQMRRSLVARFMEYLATDLNNGRTALAGYAMRDLAALADQEAARLTAILNGQILPTDSPKRTTDEKPLPVNGRLVQTVTWANSTTETRPVFLFGFSGSTTMRNDISFLAGLGCNACSSELGPRYAMPYATQWNPTNPAASTLQPDVMQYWQDFMTDANEVGMLTDFMLSPHYIQTWFIDAHPEWNIDLGGFLKYAINQPDVQSLIGWTCRLMVDQLKAQPAYWSSCLINEPAFLQWAGDPDTAALWLSFLQARYNNSLAQLNARWQTSYTTWSQVPMYLSPPSLPFPASPGLYDWMKFNDQRIADWVQWLNGYVAAADPTKLTHAKQNNRFFTQYDVFQGSDIDQMCRFTTGLAGHDIGLLPTPVTGTGPALSPAALMMCNSIFRVVSGKPVYISENHLLTDANTDDVLPGHVRAALWLDALSGADASTAWIWDRNDSDPNSLFLGLWQYRPGPTEEYVRTGLDLMRLMPKVAALRQAPARVAVLYSRTSALRDPGYAAVVQNTYELLLESGINVEAITEQMVANGEVAARFPGLRAMVLPECTYLPDEVYSGLVSLSQGGARLIGVGSAIAGKNAYTFTRNSPFAESGVTYTGLTYGNLETLRSQLVSTLNTAGVSAAFTLIDQATGQAAKGVIYRTADAAGRILATAVNLNRTPITVSFSNGSTPNFTDLLSLVPNAPSTTITLNSLDVAFGDLGPGQHPLVLTVTPTVQDVSGAASTTTFAVSNSGDAGMTWTATVTEGSSWLSITSGTSGTDNGTITVNVLRNNNLATGRTGTIQITAPEAAGSPVVVTVVQAHGLFPGDANGDNQVTFEDFAILQNHYGQSVTAYTCGDFDGDGHVTFADFALLQNNYGKTAAPASGAASTLATGITGNDAAPCAPLGVVLFALVGLSLLSLGHSAKS